MAEYKLGEIESLFADMIWQEEPLTSRRLAELAEEVFQRLNNAGGLENEFLLCYDNTLATIEFSWTPTQEQMELAGRKLASSADFGIW